MVKAKIYQSYNCQECGKRFKRPRPHVTSTGHGAFKSYMKQVRARYKCPACKGKLTRLKRGK